jgi:hypothetical protein
LLVHKSADRFVACLAGADADGLRKVEHENLPVADVARARALDDGVDGSLDEIIVDGDL